MKPKVIHGENVYGRDWTSGMDVTLKTFAPTGWADQYPFKTVDSAQGLGQCLLEAVV